MKSVHRRLAMISGVMAFLLSAWLLIQARTDLGPGVESLPQDSPEFWPLDHAWSWRLKPNLFSKRQAKVVLRTMQSELPPGTTPTIRMPSEHPQVAGSETAAETVAFIGLSDKGQEGRVTCQVIDLRTIDAPLSDEAPLQLMIRFRIGGSSAWMTGERTRLPGERIVGSVGGRCRWEGDELHLFTFYTQTGQTVFAHHLLLQQSDESNE